MYLDTGIDDFLIFLINFAPSFDSKWSIISYYNSNLRCKPWGISAIRIKIASSNIHVQFRIFLAYQVARALASTRATSSFLL